MSGEHWPISPRERTAKSVWEISQQERLAILAASQDVASQPKDHVSAFIGEQVVRYTERQMELTQIIQHRKAHRLPLRVLNYVPRQYEEIEYDHIFRELQRLHVVLAELDNGNLIPAREELIRQTNVAIIDRNLHPTKLRKYSNHAIETVDLLEAITPGSELKKEVFGPLRDSLNAHRWREEALQRLGRRWERTPKWLRFAASRIVRSFIPV